MNDSIGIVITTFRNPERLHALIQNMGYMGLPDVPVHVFEDPSPSEDRRLMTAANRAVVDDLQPQWTFDTAPQWGCMQGIIQYAMENTDEEWIIYVPDDVLFTRGGLWNEVAGIRAYGYPFIGGIQAPYWNATDLVSMGLMPYREAMYDVTKWRADSIPQNPHWNGLEDLPRKYINLNGAGFSINRRLFEKMGGWPQCTWRLDEYAGYMAWKLGMGIITLPGPPRVHYFGGATLKMPEGRGFHTVEAWKEATGGTPEETGMETVKIMQAMPSESWLDVYQHFTTMKDDNDVDRRCA